MACPQGESPGICESQDPTNFASPERSLQVWGPWRSLCSSRGFASLTVEPKLMAWVALGLSWSLRAGQGEHTDLQGDLGGNNSGAAPVWLRRQQGGHASPQKPRGKKFTSLDPFPPLAASTEYGEGSCCGCSLAFRSGGCSQSIVPERTAAEPINDAEKSKSPFPRQCHPPLQGRLQTSV